MSAPQDDSSSQGGRASLDVARELGAAAIDALCIAPRAAAYLVRRRALIGELVRDLEQPSEIDACKFDGELPKRPLSIFVSCAEVSGEIHAIHLLQALRRELASRGAPPPKVFGLGGRRLAAERVEILGDPVERATMGFDGVARALPFYLGLLKTTSSTLRSRRPDVAIGVDSPALHVPIGRIARRAKTPFVHFVTPQYWGWAPWRVGRYRRAVDRALSILPFEKAWFVSRRVSCVHVGHPLLDGLPANVPKFDDVGRTRLALLGGSRSSVLARNLPWMLERVRSIAASHPGLEVVIAHDRRELGGEIETVVRETFGARERPEWLSVELGDLHRSLATASAAFSVSGTALLDLLHHRLPTVVVYRVPNSRQVALSRWFLTAPYFASINLLAAREIVPEFCFAGEGPVENVRSSVERALFDEAWRSECRSGLELAARRLGPRGACDRAARVVLATANRSPR